MNIYLAAPWANRDDAREAARHITEAGYDIMEAWWNHSESHDHDELVNQAYSDVAGIVRADTLIVLQLATSEGKAVETGIAIAQGIPVIVVGKRANLFHHLDGAVTVVETLGEALSILQGE